MRKAGETVYKLKIIKQKYLIVIPIIILILGVFFFQNLIHEVENALFEEEYIKVTNIIDLIGSCLEADPSRYWQEHEQNVIHSIEFIHELTGVYGVAYAYNEGVLTPLTTAFEVSVFDLMDYEELVDIMSAQETGSFKIENVFDGESKRDIYFYFRWTPIYSPVWERYLLVAGVSRYSISEYVINWMLYSVWGFVALTFVVNVASVAMYIKDKRKGTIQNKRVVGIANE